MSPSSQPSLKALRTFEAAARLESLTLAARELNVTVSAVAFQVRQVETSLGCKLLRREGRGLVATDAGRALAYDLGAGFAQIEATLSRFSRPSGPSITVSMLPSFAALWLLPRLGAFQREHPAFQVRVLTSERLANLRAEHVDVAIRCGPGGWPGLRSDPLFPQIFAPMCHHAHPAAVAGNTDVFARPDEELIVNGARPGEWSRWFAAQGIIRDDPARGQRLDSRELIAEAVRAGLGIGLMDVSIFEGEIHAGNLVQVGGAVPTGWTHCIVTPLGESLPPPVEAFRSWALAQVPAIGDDLAE